MSPQTTTSTPRKPVLAQQPRLGSQQPPTRMLPSPRRFWLILCCLALTTSTIALGVYLFTFATKTIPPAAERHINVPYADNPEIWEPFHSWVVQEDGRNKPFQTFSLEAVRTITGREKFQGNDPVAVVMSWLLLYSPEYNCMVGKAKQWGCDWDNYPFILCEYQELRELLYREYRGEEAELSEYDLHGKHIEPAVLLNSKELKKLLQDSSERMEQDSKASLSRLETKAREVKKRLGLYQRIRSGGQEGRERVNAPGEFGILALDKHGKTWFSLRSVREYVKNPGLWDEMMQFRRIQHPRAYAGHSLQPFPTTEVKEVVLAARNLQQAYLSGDEETFATASGEWLVTVERVSGQFTDYPATTTTNLELWFNAANPFRKAWIFSLLASLAFIGYLATQVRWPQAARVCYGAGVLGYGVALAWSVVGFYCRVTISGRPPVSNMYESVIWVAFMTATFGLILELIYRRGIIALAGTLVSTLGLVLADQLPLTLAPNIQPLQAVLRSNYWLVVHVLTIVSSYSAFALAWGLGNFNLALMVFSPGRNDLIKTVSQFCYRAIQIGVVLLAAGTLLGGFWAAESWGRFWGWDPKEVWALIALLCYVIPLHARFLGWVKDFGLAVSSVVCFASVVMAWYGVNFVLGAGLHSYGFGGGNDLWVYWGGLLNITLVGYAALRYQSFQSAIADA